MRITLNELRQIIRKELAARLIEARPGGLRTSQKMKDSPHSGRHFKIGKAAPEEVGEIDPIDVELKYPGAMEAWIEIVPELFPEFPFADDPVAIRRGTMWINNKGKLHAAFKENPNLELAEWSPEREDWFDLF